MRRALGLLALLVVSGPGDASAEAYRAAVSASNSASCLLTTVDSNLDTGSRLLGACREPGSSCEDCCRAALVVIKQAEAQVMAARVSQFAGRKMSVGQGEALARHDIILRKLNGLRDDLSRAGFESSQAQVFYRNDFSKSPKVREILSQARPVVCRPANQRADAIANSRGLAPKVQGTTVSHGAPVRRAARVVYESFLRSYGQNKVGIRESNVFSHIRRAYQKEVSDGELN